MGIAIRRRSGPQPVEVKGVRFLVNPLTYAVKAAVRAEVRSRDGGVVSDEAYARALYRRLLAGWEGLRFEDTGEDVPWGPCPECAGRTTPEPGIPCPACGGSKDCRDWALAVFPDDIWIPIIAEAGRVSAREEALLGN